MKKKFKNNKIAFSVLTGNKYLGPELEMWSMGILLYTLVFFENPFRSPQETVRADVELPWDISEGLYQVLLGLDGQ